MNQECIFRCFTAKREKSLKTLDIIYVHRSLNEVLVGKYSHFKILTISNQNTWRKLCFCKYAISSCGGHKITISHIMKIFAYLRQYQHDGRKIRKQKVNFVPQMMKVFFLPMWIKLSHILFNCRRFYLSSMA